MTYLSRRETECALEVAEQYDDIDVSALLAEIDEVPLGDWPGPYNYQGSRVYTAAHVVCARMERGQ